MLVKAEVLVVFTYSLQLVPSVEVTWHEWRRTEAICLLNITLFSRSQLKMRSSCQVVGVRNWETFHVSLGVEFGQFQTLSSFLGEVQLQKAHWHCPVAFTRLEVVVTCVNKLKSCLFVFSFLRVGFSFCFLRSWTPLLLHAITNTLLVMLGVFSEDFQWHCKSHKLLCIES